MEPDDILASDPSGKGGCVENIVQKIGADAGEYEHGRAGDDDEHQQGERHAHIDIAQQFYTAVEAPKHREDGKSCHGKDEQNLDQPGRFKSKQIRETAGRLRSADTDGRCKSENGGDNGEQVNDVTRPAPYTLAKDRVKGRSDAEWQAFIVREKTKGQANDCVNCPGRQAPVKDRCTKGEALSGRRCWLGAQRRASPVRVIGEGLGRAVEHEANSHARSE